VHREREKKEEEEKEKRGRRRRKRRRKRRIGHMSLVEMLFCIPYAKLLSESMVLPMFIVHLFCFNWHNFMLY
jgi:hypothetical protein